MLSHQQELYLASSSDPGLADRKACIDRNHGLRTCWLLLSEGQAALLMQLTCRVTELHAMPLDGQKGWMSAATRRSAHLANAVADPGAVVVEFAHAVIADGTVRAAGRPVVMTCVAPLGAHCEAVHVVLCSLHTPVQHRNIQCIKACEDHFWWRFERRRETFATCSSACSPC